ncbi:MAG: LOG family protein, partial [Anaerolineae bacterium]|nr:LOG family protein [Anaerolineae bacterium]
LSDGFIAMPGGLGTIEEFFEVLTWAQLGIHHKPCGLLNVAEYYTKLLAFMEHTAQEKFVDTQNLAMILVDDNPTALLQKFERYQPPRIDKVGWALGLNET